MDDRIRVSDADRDNVAARLRDHFAAGRLTTGEMEERISAALSAKTAGDLRRLMTDLPEPAPLAQRPQAQRPQAQWPRWDGSAWPARRRHGPRPPLILLALLAVLLVPGGGWLLFALVNLVFVLVLVTGLAAAFAVGRPHGPVRHGRPHGPYRRRGYTWL